MTPRRDLMNRKGRRAGGLAKIHKKQAVVGIMGGSTCPEDLYEETRGVARKLAEAGVTILCGGGGGVMEAAARGAREGGGLTVGIMPGSSAGESPPNEWIQLPIFTGLSDARNAVNVRTADVILAIGGAYGTLSEIALALKIGKPVVMYRTWELPAPPVGLPGLVECADDAEDAVRKVLRRLGL
jgi:uncharacterized protein (TIGR00725 family)